MPLEPKQEPPYYEITQDGGATGLYRATLEASGTSNPTTTVHANSLNETITWTRDALGVYTGAKPTPFDELKTLILVTSGGDPFVLHSKVSSGNITLQAYDNTWTGTDGLDDVSIQILTFP